MTRTVTWNLLDLTGTVNTGNIHFRFTGSFTPDSQFIKSDLIVKADADGNGSAELFVNESGSTASFYTCFLPTGEQFDFTVPVGDGDISLSLLREAGAVEGTEQFNTVVSWLQDQIDAGDFDGADGADGVDGINSNVQAVIHADVDNVARPEGFDVVIWIGSVEPINALENDIWYSTV